MYIYIYIYIYSYIWPLCERSAAKGVRGRDPPPAKERPGDGDVPGSNTRRETCVDRRYTNTAYHRGVFVVMQV